MSNTGNSPEPRRLRYEESSTTHGGVSNQEDDLEFLAIPGDGILEEGLALRDAYAADVVHMIVDQSGGGGIARVLDVDQEDPLDGFSVSNSLSWPNFLAHEVGHVMGLRHDRYTEADSGWRNAHRVLPYAYGYVNQRAFDAGASEESRWRTIMSYSRQFRHAGLGFGVQLPRFSNPNQRYPAETGDPLGVPGAAPTDAIDGPADAVRSLNETAALIAGFRESATRCDYRLSEVRRDVSASGGEFTVGVDTTSSCAWTGTAIGAHVEITAGAMGNGTGEVTYRVHANDGPARVAYVVLAGEMLPVYQSAAVAPVSVCERTPQVRDAITNATGLTCGAISEFDLLEVRSLDLGYQEIDTLRRGDFAGLSNMVELRLVRNPIATIENGAFDGLDKLDVLDLRDCDLEAVPPAIGSLRSLASLDLGLNGIEHLPQSAFAGLLELRYLNLSDNRLATLDEGVFSDQRKLLRLFLDRNRITDITKETMRGPESLELHLSNNPLGNLRPDAFAAIPKIWVLNLAATQLRRIPSQAVTNVVARLDLSDNRIDDLSRTTFPGWNLSELNLANNALTALPAGVFSGFTSTACDRGEMELDLSGNPGAPFPLTLELDRVDAGTAAPGPAHAVVRVRKGTPFSIAVRIAGSGGSSFAQEVTVINGHTESEPFEVTGDVLTELRFAAMPRIPGSYKGVRIALGEPLRLFALGDLELEAGTQSHTLDLAAAFARPGATQTFAAASNDPNVATVVLARGVLTITPTGAGTATVMVTVTGDDGERTTQRFAVTVRPPAEAERGTWHGLAAGAAARTGDRRRSIGRRLRHGRTSSATKRTKEVS